MGARYQANGAKDYITRVFESKGAGHEWSKIAAEVIVTADLFNLQTHGIERMQDYYSAMIDGKLVPGAQPEILHQTPISALVDGHEGIGHSLSVWCMRLAIDKAKKSGVGIVSLRNSNHYGFAGYYPLMAIQEHLMGFSVTNTEGLMVATGSKEALLGSNPIAFGMHAEPYPFLLDMATTVVPGGRLSLYTRDGRELLPGWGIGKDGQMSLDPAEVRAGINSKKYGGILPLGGLGEEHSGHKGFGLALMVEVLSGILAGGNTSNLIRRYDKHDRMSGLFVAMDYAMFGDAAEMEQHLSHYLRTIRESERYDPEVPIYTHGEKEFRSCTRNEVNGIYIRDVTLAEQLDVAQKLGFEAAPYFIRMGEQ